MNSVADALDYIKTSSIIVLEPDNITSLLDVICCHTIVVAVLVFNSIVSHDWSKFCKTNLLLMIKFGRNSPPVYSVGTFNLGSY